MDRVRAQEASGASSGAGGASKEGVYAGVTLWRIGPALMSGRVGDIAVDPVKHSTWYVAAASGGVWKTTNSGTTWSPIFDGYGSYSIGCVVVDPGNHLVVWVGTGENNSQRSVGYGDGLYKSIDGARARHRDRDGAPGRAQRRLQPVDRGVDHRHAARRGRLAQD
ncbi:MAG: WD40/YVTN/BNR-like repeat-containing protein, partial [Isosphaeraceae bacterium]